jgi:hypothetical protein
MNCDLWPIPEAGCYAGCDIPEGVGADLLESASIQAGVILRTLSGNRVGLCADIVRPVSECGTCRGHCTCADAGDRVRLYSAYGPIAGVGEINIDGDVVDPAEYRFYPSGQVLYRVPPGLWPTSDRKWAECGDLDTFCVQVLIGAAPDAWALAVHAELTCELLLSCTGGECRIPTNATQVTGQGVTVTLSATELVNFIPAVAAWVAAVNPAKATQPSKLYSPDTAPCGVQGSGTPGDDPFPPFPPFPPAPPWEIDEGGP